MTDNGPQLSDRKLENLCCRMNLSTSNLLHTIRSQMGRLRGLYGLLNSNEKVDTKTELKHVAFGAMVAEW